jgi:dephospho-CoA kinase
MYQVGLTGGIGSGKTLVCSVLEKLGIPVYYADTEARKLMNLDTELIDGIVALFGQEAFKEGILDRQYLATKVFGSRKKLSDLNALVHPAVRRNYSMWVEKQTDVPYVVQEAAILFESGASRFLDRTVLVYAPETLRIRRVMDRDRVEEAEVRLRMKHQMDEEEKKNLADDVIINDENEMLLPQIIQLHERIINSF